MGAQLLGFVAEGSPPSFGYRRDCFVDGLGKQERVGDNGGCRHRFRVIAPLASQQQEK